MWPVEVTSSSLSENCEFCHLTGLGFPGTLWVSPALCFLFWQQEETWVLGDLPRACVSVYMGGSCKEPAFYSYPILSYSVFLWRLLADHNLTRWAVWFGDSSSLKQDKSVIYSIQCDGMRFGWIRFQLGLQSHLACCLYWLFNHQHRLTVFKGVTPAAWAKALLE